MLTLFLLAKHEMYVNEVAAELECLSGGAFSVLLFKPLRKPRKLGVCRGICR